MESYRTLSERKKKEFNGVLRLCVHARCFSLLKPDSQKKEGLNIAPFRKAFAVIRLPDIRAVQCEGNDKADKYIL